MSQGPVSQKQIDGLVYKDVTPMHWSYVFLVLTSGNGGNWLSTPPTPTLHVYGYHILSQVFHKITLCDAFLFLTAHLHRFTWMNWCMWSKWRTKLSGMITFLSVCKFFVRVVWKPFVLYKCIATLHAAHFVMSVVYVKQSTCVLNSSVSN